MKKPEEPVRASQAKNWPNRAKKVGNEPETRRGSARDVSGSIRVTKRDNKGQNPEPRQRMVLGTKVDLEQMVPAVTPDELLGP